MTNQTVFNSNKPITQRERACKKQQCFESGSKVSADIVRNLGGHVPTNNPYSKALMYP